MTRRPMFFPRCGRMGCRLAYGHVGKRHDSTPMGRAIYATARHAGPVHRGPVFGIEDFVIMTANGPSRDPELIAEYVRRHDPGRPPLVA